MTGEPRDWDKELSDIDRLIEKGGGAPAPAARPVASGSANPVPVAAAPRPERKRGQVLGVWFRVLLGVILGVAITQWPYPAVCGNGLFLFLGAGIVVSIVGFWSALASWRVRIGAAHAVGLLVLLWGLLIVAHVILPRMGYLGSHLPWGCG